MGKIQCLQDFMDMQKNNAFCSICTVNYTSYAGVLNESLRKAGHKEPHYVLIVDYDKKYKKIIEKFDFKPVFLSKLAIPKINELIKKYSAFELSNVLKPFFLEWLLKNHKEIDKLVYLDTDIYVYSSLKEVFDYIDKNSDISVVITPHLNDYKTYNKRSDYKIDSLYLTHGLYNGGFYVIRNDKNTLQFLNWHKKKLFNYGYNGVSAYMYVDQKILDFAPILFEFVGIYKNRAYDIAHWNYYPNLIRKRNDIYYVGIKKLVFFHFSQLKIGAQDITENFCFVISPLDKRTFKEMASDYWKCLKKNNYEQIIKIPYGYKDKYKKPPLSLVNPLLAKSIELDSAIKQLDSTKVQLDSVKTQYNSIKTQLDSTKTNLELTRTQFDSAKAQLDSTTVQLNSTRTQLETIYSSRGWKLLLILRKLATILIPKGSLRRKIAVSFWKLIKLPFKLFSLYNTKCRK